VKPSKARRLADDDMIMAVLSSNVAQPYEESLNPFNPDREPLRHQRFERLYSRRRQSWLDAEARMQDLFEVYGGEPPRRKYGKTITGI